MSDEHDDGPGYADMPDDDFPIAEVVDGRWTITACLRGGPDRGIYRATGVGGAVLVTMGPPQLGRLDELAARFALGVEGVTPLRAITSIPGLGGRDVLVEAEPAGVPLTTQRPHAAREVGRQLAEIVARAHAAGLTLGGLRPELVYSDGRSCTGVAPRAELFLTTSRPPDHGVAPCFEHVYLSPELLSLLPASPASDVFSLCATLCWLLDGAPPFPGETVMAQLSEVMQGAHRALDVEPMIVAGLALDPAARPSAAAIATALTPALTPTG